MELKYLNWAVLRGKFPVLIVPLWNWNEYLAIETDAEGKVLIVPLWNWNNLVNLYIGNGYNGSNCTFMELKLASCYR